MERSRLKSVVESLLFVSESAVTLDRMSAVLEGVEKKEILSVIEELRSEYESQGRGILLFEVAGGFQMRTPKENADWVKNLLRGRAARMSRATLETLSIVAYKQPVTRVEIEHVRGVSVDGVLSTLMERRLVRIVGRKDVLGRPFLYSTTREFLELFSLKDLTGLPTLKEMEEVSLPQISEDEPLPVESEQ
ncbi:MAG: SMC-Scp complex subunit ScpB [Deltaproteobacteria bacterium]|nr:SMC-Scp complex subunit ScpB [Deltaproteobacteria bacterium]MCZ6451468.1 SMC-Scp complex subunit ScpB [Deltaproteobacteria bacterium]MCZ6548885.1 SMC-Scp complex subunit ScpB [Deltaproteobacteria bacterium]MCZ6562213.1 SMC-Scp complex subunit ScpB [Deltaproteobacteria bacterium]MCZ6621377.1 SMC-Scp complex subunit ScpB [Deltaproteobacteria bacterium]